jgi:hypothetical protein
VALLGCIGHHGRLHGGGNFIEGINMSVFYCHPCGNYVDNDYNPGGECPVTGDYVCEDCLESILEELEEQEEIEMDADYLHQEYMDALTDCEIAIRHKILEGAPKATFIHVEWDREDDLEGWLVETNGLYFAWRSEYGQGYDTYSLKSLAAGGDVQYICTGVGKTPIGYVVTEGE